MSRESSKQNHSARLLIVDDKEQMRDVLQKFLAAEGYEIETAANGKETLEKIGGQNFNLILSDIKMLGMDGDELLAEILKRDAANYRQQRRRQATAADYRAFRAARRHGFDNGRNRHGQRTRRPRLHEASPRQNKSFRRW